MPVEMADFMLPKTAARGHDPKQFFQGLRKVRRVIHSGFQDVGKEVFRKEPRVPGKHAKDNAVEKPGDAQILALGEVHFGAALGVSQFDAVPPLQGLGHFGDFSGKALRDGGGCRWWFEKIRVFKQRAEKARDFPGGQSGRW